VIVDSSALLALIRKEPEATNCFRALLLSPINRISAGTLLEASLVVDGLRNAQAARELDEVLSGFDLSVEPVTFHQVTIAREAYRRFGKGSGHPAKLNFGDCFAYALAKDFDEPLLFVGNDFVHTDILPALT
jgi:ribonuclease VapC